MGAQRILVIEDDLAIRQGVVAALRLASYEPLEAADGRRGVELAVSGGVDLVLLDLVLPALEGLAVLARIRDREPTLPVIVLTAKGGEDERVAGLEAGADDYVVKPFGIRELLARVEAVLRRSPERPQPLAEVVLPGLTVDLDAARVRFEEGGAAELTPLEIDLLRYLIAHRERVISREELLTRVWKKRAHWIATRSVDMTLARLRKKLREEADRPFFQAVRGKGYRWLR